MGIIAPEGVRGAPDLVVEVLSPTNAHRDRVVSRVLPDLDLAIDDLRNGL